MARMTYGIHAYDLYLRYVLYNKVMQLVGRPLTIQERFLSERLLGLCYQSYSRLDHIGDVDVDRQNRRWRG